MEEKIGDVMANVKVICWDGRSYIREASDSEIELRHLEGSCRFNEGSGDFSYIFDFQLTREDIEKKFESINEDSEKSFRVEYIPTACYCSEEKKDEYTFLKLHDDCDVHGKYKTYMAQNGFCDDFSMLPFQSLHVVFAITRHGEIEYITGSVQSGRIFYYDLKEDGYYLLNPKSEIFIGFYNADRYKLSTSKEIREVELITRRES